MEKDFFSQWFTVLWRRKGVIILFLALVLVATVFFTRRQTPIYEAQTKIIIELEAPKYMPYAGNEVVSLGAGRAWDSTEFLETQYRIIKSRKVAAVVASSNLPLPPAYAKKLGRETLRLDQDHNFLGIDKIEDPEQREQAFANASAVDRILAGLSVEPVAKSRVVYINFRDSDPMRAQLIADAVARAYIEQNLQSKDVAVAHAVEWLTQKQAELGAQLQNDEQALLDFKREHGILSDLNDRQALLGHDLQDASRQLRQARREVAHQKTVVQSLKRLDLNALETSVESIVENSLIQRLKERLIVLENERTDLLRRYLEKHPDVEAQDQKIDRVRTLLKREVEGLRALEERALAAAEDNVHAQENEVSNLESEARDLHDLELKYRQLSGALESTKVLYDQMQLRLKEAELQAQTKANNVSVLDSALLPVFPVSPRLMLNLFVGLLLGLIGGIGLAFLAERLDSTVNTQEQIEELFGWSLLGLVSTTKNERSRDGAKLNLVPERCVLEAPSSTVAEQMRALRTNLLFLLPSKSEDSNDSLMLDAEQASLRVSGSLLVTSALASDGKTMVSSNLAAVMALGGSRVLLIDADLRRSRLLKVFKPGGSVRNDYGFSDYLIDLKVKRDIDVNDYVKHVEMESEGCLDVLTAGRQIQNPAELLQSQAFVEAFERFQKAYDLVIFDSPPICAISDALIIAQRVLGTLLVVRAEKTDRSALHFAQHALGGVNARVFGVALNDVNFEKSRYAKGYYGGYGYYHHSYAYRADSEHTGKSVS